MHRRPAERTLSPVLAFRRLPAGSASLLFVLNMRICFVSWALLTGLLLGCRPAEEAGPVGPETARPNVILISIDTLRADHLGCYGYERATSPALDALCEDAVVFEQAIAQAPSTLHSHASILTSLLPHHHGASWSARTRLGEECLTLPEVVLENGFTTAAFTGGGQMDRVFGLDQGFESYEQPSVSHFRGTVNHATQWLDEHSSQPFFLFLHTYETHTTYNPEPRFLELFETDYAGDLPAEVDVDLLRKINRGEIDLADGDLEHIINLYDAEIRSMDEGLAQLVAYLKENSLYDNSLIVLTSDHGEEFGEHGTVGWHSHTLFDELLLVPLVVKYPNQESGGTVVAQQVSGIDIAPTVLGQLGIPIPERFSGEDLTLLVGENAGSDRTAISRMDRKASNDIDSVRTPEWKLFRGKLFDLGTDPAELWDTALNKPGVVEKLGSAREAALESRTACVGSQVLPTGKTLDELKALGYL